jgi:hypothetical protein
MSRSEAQYVRLAKKKPVETTGFLLDKWNKSGGLQSQCQLRG